MSDRIKPKNFLCFLVLALFIEMALLFPVTPAFAEEDDATSQVEETELGISAYHDVTTHWGFEVTSSLNAFGGKALTVEQGDKPAYAISFLGEYQPPLIQGYGILGIGPSFTFYPIFGGNVTNSALSLYTYGGQIRYQARYFHEQLIVPMVAYSVETFNYNFKSGASGNFISRGPSLGIWLLLNPLDSSSATSFYMTTRIARSYVVLEGRNMNGSDSNLSISGFSLYFGLRFEI